MAEDYSAGWRVIFTEILMIETSKSMFTAIIKDRVSRLLLPALCLATSIVVFTLIVRGVWTFTIDDAFIGFRYAKNLVATGSIVWNVGEKHIEGFTSLIWILLSAIPHLLRIDVVVFIKIAGIIFTIAYAVALFSFVEALRKDIGISTTKLAGYLSVLLISVFPPTVIYSIAGLETSLFILFAVLFLRSAWMLGHRPSGKVAFTTAILAFLLGVTRPDGNLIAILGIVTAIILNQDARRIRIAKYLLWYVGLGAVYFVWRYWYFGHLFPLPFYVKVAHSFLGGLPIVSEFVKFFVMRAGVPLLVGLSLVRKRHLSILIPGAAYLIFYIFPEHMMGQNFRFLAPVTPVIILFISLGLVKIYESLEGKKLFFIPMAALVALLLVWYAPGNISAKQSDANGLQQAHLKLAQVLKEVDPTGKSTIAFADAGAVPYYSDWRVIDTFSLNDASIATTGAHDPQYLLEQKVDVVVLASENAEKFVPILSWDDGYYKAITVAGMEKIAVFPYDEGDNLWVFADPKSNVGRKFLDIYKGL